MIGLRHERPLPCSCSCYRNKVQSGLLDMLIFYANICVWSSSNRKQEADSCCCSRLTYTASCLHYLLVSLQHRVRRSATLCSRPMPESSTTQVTSLSSSSTSATLNHFLLSAPDIPPPPPSPSPPPCLTRSVCHTALDTLTGGGSQAGQFPPGLRLLCIRIAKGFSVFRLDCTPA